MEQLKLRNLFRKTGLNPRILLPILIWAISSHIGTAEPVVNSTLRPNVDQLSRYHASGELTTAVEVSSGKLTGPFFTIPAGGSNQCWIFRVGHNASDITGSTAKGVQIKLEGEHHCFHEGENSPNLLPLIHSTPPVDIANGANASISVWGGVSHPGRKHFDYYTVHQWATVKVLGQTLNLGLEDAVVEALHQIDDPGWEPAGETVGITEDLGAVITYLADTRRLRFTIPTITVLDSQGGGSGGIAPDYATDPVLRAPLIISEVAVPTNPDSQGWYHTGAGSVSLLDPEGAFNLHSNFRQLRIRTQQHDGGPITEGTARLMEGALVFDGTGYAPDHPEGSFLNRFIETNLLHNGLEKPLEYSLGLRFQTSQDLIAATDGFTRDAQEIPCNVFVCLLRNPDQEPEPEGLRIQRFEPIGGNQVRLQWNDHLPVMIEFSPWSSNADAGWLDWQELEGPVEGGEWSGLLPAGPNAGRIRLRPVQSDQE